MSSGTYRETDAEKVIILKSLDGGVTWVPDETGGGAGGGGVTDHGALTGLGDDDHPQYALTTEIGSAVQAWDADLDNLAINWLRSSATNPSSLDFEEDTDNGSNRGRLRGPDAIASDRVWQLPDAGGVVALDTSAVMDGDTAGGDLSGTYPNPTVTKLPRVILSDAGVVTADSTTQQTLLNGTFDFPANSLAVGDWFEINYNTFAINTTGGNITLAVTATLDGADNAEIPTANIANGSIVNIFGRLFGRVNAIGGSGSVFVYHTLFVSGSLATPTVQFHSSATTVTRDTTQALTLDLQGTRSSAASTLDWTSNLIIATWGRTP